MKVSARVKQKVDTLQQIIEPSRFDQVMQSAYKEARRSNTWMVSQRHIEHALIDVLGENTVPDLIVPSNIRDRASLAVNGAVLNGKMKPVKEYKCATCERQAAYHHHWSYKKEHVFSVIPLCAKCHGAVYTGDLVIDDPESLAVGKLS